MASSSFALDGGLKDAAGSANHDEREGDGRVRDGWTIRASLKKHPMLLHYPRASIYIYIFLYALTRESKLERERFSVQDTHIV